MHRTLRTDLIRPSIQSISGLRRPTWEYAISVWYLPTYSVDLEEQKQKLDYWFEFFRFPRYVYMYTMIRSSKPSALSFYRLQDMSRFIKNT
jgi:hypothetical protein